MPKKNPHRREGEQPTWLGNPLFSPQQTADILGIHVRTLAREHSNHLIGSVRTGTSERKGGKVMYRLTDIQEYIARKSRPSIYRVMTDVLAKLNEILEQMQKTGK